MDRHGGNIFGPEQIRLDFSVNTNPLGMPEAIRRRLRASEASWERYPDSQCRLLREQAAQVFLRGGESCGGNHSTDENALDGRNFLFGNGASDLLFSLAFALRPQRALVAAPCFSEYERALLACGCRVSCLKLRAETGFCPEAEEAALREFLKGLEPPQLLVLGNPNNPTGRAVRRSWLLRLSDACREAGCLLLLDECFNWFLENREEYSFLPAIRREPDRYAHVLILNAFTKIFSMAGLRLGYLFCADRRLLEKIEEARQPWSVSGPAQAAGDAALALAEAAVAWERECPEPSEETRAGESERPEPLETASSGERERQELPDSAFIRETAALVRRERAFLEEGLRALGFAVWPSQVNYILFRRAAGDARDYAAYCRARGILIRSCANFYGLDENYYRVAVRCRRENEALLSCLSRARREAECGEPAREIPKPKETEESRENGKNG